jgi:hypothetical protein
MSGRAIADSGRPLMTDKSASAGFIPLFESTIEKNSIKTKLCVLTSLTRGRSPTLCDKIRATPTPSVENADLQLPYGIFEFVERRTVVFLPRPRR